LLSVSTVYDFTKSGSGDYTVEASNLFTYVDADGTPKDLYANVQDVAEVKLSGNLAVSNLHVKRASFVGCSALRQSQLNTAAVSAQYYAIYAYNYISSLSSVTARYKTWFGTYTPARKNAVQSHYQLIKNHAFSSYKYDCTCNDPGIYAYVCAYIL